MNFTATVVKDTIRLPAGVHFPDGTRVIVEAVNAQEDTPRRSLSQSLEKFIGIAEDLPSDLARNLDSYIHGQTKLP
jgi:hypothetical protein